MELRITIRDLPERDELRALAEERATAALRRFDARIARVALRLEDLSGPGRVGDDKLCRVDVTLSPAGRVLIEERGASPAVALAAALDRLKAALSRTTGRMKRGVGAG